MDLSGRPKEVGQEFEQQFAQASKQPDGRMNLRQVEKFLKKIKAIDQDL